MHLSLNRTDTIQPLVAYLVRGRRLNEDGSISQYTGMTWGRTPQEARERHERLNAADRRIRQAVNDTHNDLDLSGYDLEFVAVPPTH